MRGVLDGDGMDKAVSHALGCICRHHAHCQGQEVGRDGAVGVASANEECVVDGLERNLCFAGKACCIGSKAELRCVTLHHAVEIVIISRGNEPPVGFAGRVLAVHELGRLWRDAPVAVAVVRHKPVFVVVAPYHVKETLYGRIALAHGAQVAILAVKHLAGKGEAGWPRYVGVVEPPVGRCDIADAPVGTLAVAYVAHPLGVKRVVVHEVALAEAAHGAVAEPRHALVALGAVDGHTLVVAAHPTPGIGHDGVEQALATGLVGCESGAVVHAVGYQLAHYVARGYVVNAGYLHVAEAVVCEFWRPASLAAVADIPRRGLCTA